MGANIVANYLGLEGPQCFIKAAVCVQPPMKMWETGNNIRHGNWGFFNYALGRNVKVKFDGLANQEFREIFKATHGLDLKDVLEKSRTIIDIDSNLTSKVFGFGTVENYYDKASCVHRLPSIKIPTFIMMALDDPVIGKNSIDRDVCSANPYILLGVTEQGGHLGYFESIMSTDQWFPQPALEFLNSFK